MPHVNTKVVTIEKKFATLSGMAKRRVRAQPTLPTNKTALIQLRLTESEKTELSTKAAAAGKKLSAYLREKGLAS